MKKIVFVVAPEVFRDEEYIEPKTILEAAGVEVTTASTVVGEIYGKIKIKAQSQMLAKDIKVEDFDGIFFVGGGGASVYFEDKSDGTNKVILCNSFTSYSDGSVTIHSESKDFVYKNSERIYYHHINDNSYGKTLTAEEISKFQTGRKTETNNKGTD